LSPKVLDQVLTSLPRVNDPRVLVGFDTSDDAGVFKLTEECALVQTVDFFTPIVDDPFTFGAIAAANSVSDVYAMGGVPLTALSILAYPAAGDLADLAEIIRGGAEKLREAGCPVIGGHSVNDDEIKFGYAVTGSVHPSRVLTNAGARPGDVLIFTKRLGTGVISTALKRGIASEVHVNASLASMLTLNRAAAEAMNGLEVHACTDVTGFGFIGHAREIAAASKVTLEIDSRHLEFLDGALDYARAGAVPAGLKNNREFAGSCVAIESPIDPAIEDLLYDPQTSGGLLISLPPGAAAQLRQRLAECYEVGRVVARRDKPIHLA
jgi:selenide, water dikinase